MSLEEQATSDVTPGENSTAISPDAQEQSQSVQNSVSPEPAKKLEDEQETAASAEQAPATGESEPVSETPPPQAPEPAEPVTAAEAVVETAAETPSEPPQAVVTEQQPAPPEVPAETVAAEPAAVEPAAAEPVAEESSAPRKVQLNPTMPAGTTKAVPTLPAEPGGEVRAASAEVVPPKGPVEIPKAESLDEDLESQLNAALQAGAAVSAVTNQMEQAGLPKDESELEPGTKLKGKVESIDDENLIIDLGYRASGLLNRRHFPDGKVPEVGSELEVVVESVSQAEGLIHLGLLRGVHRSGGDWNSLAVGQVVECLVEKTNKGGLAVVVSQLRGFMPAGHVDLHFVGDLEPFVGQKLIAKVIDVNPKKRNLVVSRKALMQEEREANEAVVWDQLTVGEQRTGTVKTLKDYGAFIDIGGIDGLLHVRELSWTRVNHPSDVLQEGQQVEVKILTIDNDKKKISLGMKQLMANPWDYAEQKYPKNTVISGLVKKVTEFGAFVEIEPGLEGLIHISELDYKRVNQVQDVLKEGQETEAQVLEINKNKKRISLSIKALKPKPQPTPEQLAEKQASEEEEQQRREADLKRRKTLKGGIGGNKGGGLFGNPSDF